VLEIIAPLVERHLPPTQFGFRQGRGTIDALLYVEQAIANGFEACRRQRPPVATRVAVIGLDTRKAFDTVPFDQVQAALADIPAMPAWALKWIDAYLHGRTMYVQVNEARSHTVDITSSVPQGSKVGPLLFNVATKDLQSVQLSAGTTLAIYADDVCLTKPLLTAASVSELEADADNVIAHSNRIGLRNNADKNTYMIASLSPKTCVESPIHIGGVDVAASDHLVYLGVNFDRALTFVEHVHAKAIAARRKLAHLHACLRTHKQYSTIAHIYQSIIRPALTYSAVLFVGVNANNGKTITRVDRLAARHATNKPRSSDASRQIAGLGWTNVEDECRF
jgi:hypothetical protein